MPREIELHEICKAAGRTVTTFRNTLQLAKERWRLANVQNPVVSHRELRRSANPIIAKQIKETEQELPSLGMGVDTATGRIAQLEALREKIPQWREEYVEAMTGTALRATTQGKWPPWLDGQRFAQRVITPADIDPECVERFFAKQEAKLGEIPRLEQTIEANTLAQRRVAVRIEAMKQRQLDWTEFLF